ncbi:MAG: DUF3857 domain-containing protein [Myxococcota bacterium]|nr:DUF3857 domain-containing protein [Myxococcota bacterium]
MRWLLVFLLASFSAAAGAEALPEWLRFAPNLAQPLEAAKAVEISEERVEALESEGHAFVEALRSSSMNFGVGGRLVERVTVARRLMTKEGVHAAGTLRASIRSDLTRVLVESAYVLAPDGRRTAFRPETIQIVQSPDPDVFSDVHDLAFPFSGLAPGSTVVLVLVKTVELEEWPLPWSQLHYPQRGAPVEQFRVDVSWAAGETPIALVANDPQMECRQPTPRSHQCRRSLVPALASDPEVDWLDVVPHVAIAQETRWKDLARREWELVTGAQDPSELVPTVRQIVDGARGERALRRLYRFVSDEIRYVAFAHGTSAVVPHPPGVTLERRFGDCKDKVALFVALARAAGFEAAPVLVATNRYELGELLLPSWTYFNHMVACVERGGRVCLEFTDPSLSFGSLPIGLEGAVSLDLAAEAPSPTTLPARAHGWSLEVKTENILRCDGGVDEKSTRRFARGGAALYRSALRSMSREARDAWLRENYQDVMGDRGSDLRVAVEGVSTPTKTLDIVSQASYAPFHPLEQQTEFYDYDFWLRDMGLSMRTQNQRQPLRSVGLRVASTGEFRLCGTRSFSFLGPELDFESRFGSLRRQYERVHSGLVKVRTVLEIPRQVVRPEDLSRYNRFIEQVVGQSNVVIGYDAAGAPQ